jgi:hypothetical protein
VSVGLFVLLLFFPKIGASQQHWNVILSLPNGDPFQASYFLNESVGFIASQYRDGVLKTTDGGQTWVSTPLPHFPPVPSSDPSKNLKDTDFTITQIRMLDPLNGWLTCEPDFSLNIPRAYPGLYRTTDGGASWNPAKVSEDFSDVYETSRALIMCSRDPDPVYGTGYISLDNGTTFSPGIPNTNGIDFVDDMHGVVTGYHYQVWSHTTDGGITWTNLAPPQNIESWSVYGVKGSKWFFTASEGDWDGSNPHIPTTIQYSSDFGATWNIGTTLPFRTNGHIIGFGFTLYVQDENEPLSINGVPVPHSGLWRSKDSGKTWVSIGGPDSYEDVRFFVTGCRGEVIYAFDNNGRVWKTTDGGDGSLPPFQPLPTVLNVDSINICQPRDTSIAVKNLGCDTVFIVGANAPIVPTLDIIDPATGNPPVFPLTILPYDSTNLKLQLSSNSAGAYQTKVYLQIEHAGLITYDTVSINSGLRFFNPLRALSNVKFDSTALCQFQDSALSIKNDSCFTVQIVSSQMKYGTSFMLDTAFANDSITQYSQKNFSIRFSPTATGKIVDSVIVNLLILGKPVRVAYPVSGIGTPDSSQLIIADKYGNPLPNEIDFDTITRCDTSLFVFTITEHGCDRIYVKVEWLDSTKTKAPPFSQFRWDTAGLSGRWIVHTDTLIDGIEALPKVLGSYEGYLRIIDSAAGKPSEVVSFIPYKVFVEPGPRTLSLSDTLRDFDTITFCGQKDITIPIVNLGVCDTIHDSSISISGLNFSIVNPPKTPFVIPPLGTFLLQVQYVPVNSGLAMDTITVVTDADSAPIRKIPLLGYAIPTDTIKFTAVASNLTVVPGDTATLTIMPSAKFKNAGLNSVYVVLQYNGDIMVPYPDNAPNATTGMAGALSPGVGPTLNISPKLVNLPITINGTNMTFDSTTPILKMWFRIMLSDSTTTDFHIASFELNYGDLNFNKCLLGATADTGTIGLRYVCGDSQLYKFLRYGSNWSIDEGIVPANGSAHPNPVMEGSQISIPFTTLRAVAVKIEILDETGSVVYSGMNSYPEAGATTFTIPGSTIGSGAYHYRLHPIDGGSGVAMGSFVVIR